MRRKKFRWVNPVTGKKYKLDVVPDFKRVLRKIETDEEAEDFFAAYVECCDDEKQAEHNIGYIAGLVKNSDIREDILDLFLVEEQVEPIPLFKREYSLSPHVRRAA
jgi:hypothetical protein